MVQSMEQQLTPAGIRDTIHSLVSGVAAEQITALSSVLKACEGNRKVIEEYVAAGVVRYVASLLDSTSDVRCTAACRVLVVFCTTDSGQAAIRASGAVRVLIQLALEGVRSLTPTSETVLDLLYRLSCASDANRQLVMEEGGIGTLLKCCELSSISAIIEAAIKVLANISFLPEAKQKLRTAGGLALFGGILRRSADEVAKLAAAPDSEAAQREFDELRSTGVLHGALKGVGVQCWNDADGQQAVQELGLVHPVVVLATSGGPRTSSLSLDVIQMICSSSHGQRAVADARGVQHIHSFLRSHLARAAAASAALLPGPSAAVAFAFAEDCCANHADTQPGDDDSTPPSRRQGLHPFACMVELPTRLPDGPDRSASFETTSAAGDAELDGWCNVAGFLQRCAPLSKALGTLLALLMRNAANKGFFCSVGGAETLHELLTLLLRLLLAQPKPPPAVVDLCTVRLARRRICNPLSSIAPDPPDQSLLTRLVVEIVEGALKLLLTLTAELSLHGSIREAGLLSRAVTVLRASAGAEVDELTLKILTNLAASPAACTAIRLTGAVPALLWKAMEAPTRQLVAAVDHTLRRLDVDDHERNATMQALQFARLLLPATAASTERDETSPGIAAPAATVQKPLPMYSPDDVCALLAELGVADTSAFRHSAIGGGDLLELDEASMRQALPDAGGVCGRKVRQVQRSFRAFCQLQAMAAGRLGTPAVPLAALRGLVEARGASPAHADALLGSCCLHMSLTPLDEQMQPCPAEQSSKAPAAAGVPGEGEHRWGLLFFEFARGYPWLLHSLQAIGVHLE